MISRNEAIKLKLLQNPGLTEKKMEHYKKYIKVENYEYKKYTFLKAYIKVKNYKFENYRFLKAYIKMEKVIKFGDIEIHKQTFRQHQEPISIKNVDIDKNSSI